MISRKTIITQDPYLTNMAIMYSNRDNGWAATHLLPILDTGKKRSGTYRKWGKSMFREYDDRMPRLGHAPMINIETADPGTFALIDRGLEDGYADKDNTEFMGQGVNLREITSYHLTDNILLNRERRASAILTSSSYLTRYSALALGDRWDNYESADSDPFADVETARASIHERTGTKMNKAIVGRQVWNKVKHHPLIRERVQYVMATKEVDITPNLVGQVLGLTSLVIGDALYVTTKEGQTATLGYVWGKNVIFAHVDDSITNQTRTLGLTPSYYGTNNQGIVVNSWRESGIEGEFIRVGADECIELVDADCGYLLQTVVS